jgi:dihydrofolate synthase/folylpolyglutamate synthase
VDCLRFIHVAGTNGKGSTCAMLESIYRAAGLRIGLFTSPHLVSFRERIQVNRQLLSEADVVRLVEEMKTLVERGWGKPEAVAASFSLRNEREAVERNLKVAATEGSHPTFFEVVTVMALRYFAEQQCDLVIWETGMGGRLDATNIVTPLASVITNVQLDHQQWLGNTITEIAAEKAGIIKPGVPVVTATDVPEALEVIEQTAAKLNAPLTKAGQASSLCSAGKMPTLPLLGEHQRLNAALAMAIVEMLRDEIPVGGEVIRRGLETVQWPGRLQRVETASGQIILLDGAHNAAGANALRATLEKYFPNHEPTLVLGMLEDKDWQSMCQALATLAGRIVLAPVNSERTAAPEVLREPCRVANPTAQVIACSSLADALKEAANDPFVVVTGSLYLVGEAMETLGILPVTTTDERGLNEWSQTRQ